MTDIQAVGPSLDFQDVFVFFGFDGFDFSPHVISKALCLSPGTSSYSVVDPVFNSWAIMSDIITNDVNEHLRYLLEQIEGRENCIRAEWNPHFKVLWQMDYLPHRTALTYDADVICRIGKCKASLSVVKDEPSRFRKMVSAKLAASR